MFGLTAPKSLVATEDRRKLKKQYKVWKKKIKKSNVQGGSTAELGMKVVGDHTM